MVGKLIVVLKIIGALLLLAALFAMMFLANSGPGPLT